MKSSDMWKRSSVIIPSSVYNTSRPTTTFALSSETARYVLKGNQLSGLRSLDTGISNASRRTSSVAVWHWWLLKEWVSKHRRSRRPSQKFRLKAGTGWTRLSKEHRHQKVMRMRQKRAGQRSNQSTNILRILSGVARCSLIR